MKLTNKLNLPLPIVEAVKNDDYTRGKSDVSATQLVEPAQLWHLKQVHHDELEEDVSERIYSLQGQSVHTILERASKSLGPEWVVEKRFFAEILGWTISGQIDVFNIPDGLLADYKLTSVYSVKDGPKEEYVKQLNIGAELLRRAGYVVNKLQIHAILRDWSKREFEREQADAVRKFGPNAFTNYPEHQVKVLDVPIVPREEVVAWLESEVKLRKAVREGKQVAPECTPEDMWERPGKYAVIKTGAKKAFRLFDTEQDAKMFMSSLAEHTSYQVVYRPGERIRCESYCAVSKFCKQFQKYNGGT